MFFCRTLYIGRKVSSRFATGEKWDLLYQRLRKGYIPSISKSRAEIMCKFLPELRQTGMSEVELFKKGARELATILFQLYYEKLYAVPFQLVTFDLEFTDIPRFTKEGPTASIIEFGAYHPESKQKFERLVLPTNSAHEVSPSTQELTGIKPSELREYGKSYNEVWYAFLHWINRLPQPSATVSAESLRDESLMGTSIDFSMDEATPETSSPEAESASEKKDTSLLDSYRECKPSEKEVPALNADMKYLFLSHGGRLADVSMLKWECKQCDLELPSEVTFGDTYGLTRDRHRRRPVTSNMLPPAWGLVDLKMWMNLPTKKTKAHRALNDAVMTWEVLEETLRRYGTENLTPKQQLGETFFKAAVDKIYYDA